MVPAPESAARGFDGRVSLRQYIPAGGEVTVSWQMDQPLARVQLGPQLAERQKEGVLQFQAKDSQVLFIEFQNDTKQGAQHNLRAPARGFSRASRRPVFSGDGLLDTAGFTGDGWLLMANWQFDGNQRWLALNQPQLLAGQYVSMCQCVM